MTPSLKYVPTGGCSRLCGCCLSYSPVQILMCMVFMMTVPILENTDMPTFICMWHVLSSIGMIIILYMQAPPFTCTGASLSKSMHSIALMLHPACHAQSIDVFIGRKQCSWNTQASFGDLHGSLIQCRTEIAWLSLTHH